MIQFRHYIIGFDPTNPYSDVDDHDYLDFSVQLGRVIFGLQFYFFPVSLWSTDNCCFRIYRRWIKINLPTLWLRVNLTIFPKPNTHA